MEGTRRFLEVVIANGLLVGNLRGVFHIAIGRKLTDLDGTLVSLGVTWRELSMICKLMKLDRQIVRELGEDPETLLAKNRENFWYLAVTHAKVNSPQAIEQADSLIIPLKKLGILVGPAPGTFSSSSKIRESGGEPKGFRGPSSASQRSRESSREVKGKLPKGKKKP